MFSTHHHLLLQPAELKEENMYSDSARYPFNPGDINISNVERSEEIILRPHKLQKQKDIFQSDLKSESGSETTDKKFPVLRHIGPVMNMM